MNRLSPKIFLTVIFLAVLISSGFFYFTRETKNDSSAKNYVKDETSVKPDVNSGSQIKKDIKILFLGDMMFDRYIRQVAQRHGNDFIMEKTKNEMGRFDLVVGNLGGPITSTSSVSVGTSQGEAKNYILTFDPSWAKTLYGNNIRLVNLGNNHILNQKEEGLIETKKYLDEAGVEYFGDTSGVPDDTGPDQGNVQCAHHGNCIIKNISGTKVAYMNYNQFSRGSYEKTIESIKEVKNETDALIVYTHWGVEYADIPKEKIKNLAHEFIDAGADLIIGTHPHVTQEKEEYKGKMIYYSLGNFIFDQYFDPRTQKGLAVEATFDPNKKSFDFRNREVMIQRNAQTSFK